MNEKKNESIETKETNEQTPVNQLSRNEIEATVEELRAYKCEADEKIATLEKEIEKNHSRCQTRAPISQTTIAALAQR